MQRRNLLLSAAAAGLGLAGQPAWSNSNKASNASGGLDLGTGKGSAPLYQPTRYVFVADMMSNFIAVVDLQSGKSVDLLNFGIRPHVMELARDDEMLAVGSPQTTELCLMNLKTRQITRMQLPAPTYQLFFVPQSTLLAVGMRDRVGLIDYHYGSLKVFDRLFDSPQRNTSLESYYSLLFSSFSQSYWVLDEKKPFIYHKRGQDPADSAWRELDFSKRLNIQGGFDTGVASPEDYLLTFTTEDGTQGLIYFPESDKLISTGNMRSTGNTYKPMLTPYIDAYTKNVIFGNKSGNMVHFNLAQNPDKPERFTVDFSPRIIRSGWLESTWVLGGDKGLTFQSFTDPADRKHYRFVPEVTNIWVTGDSKTALVTLDEGPPHLIPYDIRTREQLKPIFVSGVAMPAKVRMGSNNSICY